LSIRFIVVEVDGNSKRFGLAFSDLAGMVEY